MTAQEFNNNVLTLKDKVFRFARSILLDNSEADDVTQDIYEKIWKRRDSMKDYNNIESVVMTATRNQCIDHIRKRRQNSDIEQLSIPNEEDIQHCGEVTNLAELAKKAMSSLPEKQRIVMHLRDIEMYEIEDIAQTLQMDEATVRVNLSRARNKVKEILIKNMNYGIR